MTELKVNRAYLSLGSNIHPARNVAAAASALLCHGTVVAVSQVWESPPADLSDQDNYLNAAVLLETTLSASQLYADVIRPIEHSLKRRRDSDNKNAPRTIDIDVSLFNDEVLELGHRRIPDPDIVKYAFLALPLAQVAPTFVHPKCGRTLGQIAEELKSCAPMIKLRPDVIVLPQCSNP